METDQIWANAPLSLVESPPDVLNAG